MKWGLPRFWVDNFRGFNYGLTWQERRNLVLGRLETSGFGWWIVIVAGLGFLTDAYDIFAINAVIPMLGTVYWGGDVPAKYQLAMNVGTLLGSMIGQISFGILADIHGRRKIYGLELVVTIVASLSFASASSGVNNSMSLIAWLIFWRIVMGIGIGADYPLSAVITAEFSPTKYRGRMIAAVFFCQALGQMFATLTAYTATVGFKKYIVEQSDPKSCSIYADPRLNRAGADCARTVDQIWRLVAGLGAFPAALAIVSRLTIPESVYWVLDVKNDSNEAMQTRDYWPVPSNSDGPDLGGTESIHMEDMAGGSQADEESHSQGNFMASGLSPRQGSHFQEDAIAVGQPLSSHAASGIQDAHQDAHSLGMSPNNEQSIEDPHPREQSLKDFWEFMFGAKGSTEKGNWTDLLATSLNWMVFDFAFYILGVNSSRLIPKMFNVQEQQQSPYSRLSNNGWHTLVATCIGATVGGAIAIKIMNNFSRRKIQMWTFLVLAFLFAVLGVLFVTLLGAGNGAVIVAVYVICQLLFNIGPNTTTFIIPAEAFPTRYRCTCHGISAASGKLGSVLGQLVVTGLVDDDHVRKSLGYLLISFVVVMIAGALISKFITPETCDIWGQSRKLEDLSFGKARRQELQLAEENAVNNLRRRAGK